eukprot:6476249-Amphidinium_carterae.1
MHAAAFLTKGRAARMPKQAYPKYPSSSKNSGAAANVRSAQTYNHLLALSGTRRAPTNHSRRWVRQQGYLIIPRKKTNLPIEPEQSRMVESSK